MQETNNSRPALPGPGYRFRPTDGELLGYYLRHKVSGTLPFEESSFIRECDLYGTKEPWEIWEEHGGREEDEEDLYFFTNLKKNSEGTGLERTVGTGTWHGQDTSVTVKSNQTKKSVGMIKTFQYKNPTSEHDRCWLMLEYSLVGSAKPIVLCRLRKNPRDSKKNADANQQEESCCSSSSHG